MFTRGKQHDKPVKRFDKLWRKAAAMAGVREDLLVHDLRRTACRNMLSAGFTETKIMEICGWKTRSMFLRYALTNPADLKREMPKLAQYLDRARTEREAVAAENSALSLPYVGRDQGVVVKQGETCRSEQRRASVRNNRAEIGQNSRKPAARALEHVSRRTQVSGRRKSELAGI